MKIAVRSKTIATMLRLLLTSGLQAVEPATASHQHVRVKGRNIWIGRKRYSLQKGSRMVVVGGGKASASMAESLERLTGALVEKGLVIVKYGHDVPTKRITVLEGGHPLPDEAGRRAAERILALTRELHPRDLLIVLISGGASSLLPAPAPGIRLGDKRKVTDLLLRSGATIGEINTVRKHLSAIKGGMLAASTRARVACLILSDVMGDEVGAIGSGPTAPDPTTYEDAKDILHHYDLWSRVPSRVRAHLLKGVRGRVPETPKPGSGLFRRVQNLLIGNSAAAVRAAAEAASRSGLRPLILSTSLVGDARAAAKVFGALAREIAAHERPVRPPACVIAGGELTVVVKGRGRGGRAQEFALAAALEIDGLRNVWIAGFGTDGTDGPTDVAGAVVDGSTLKRARRLGLDATTALTRSDSYSFFRKVGGHIVTGPTRTNVNDLYLLIVC